MQRPELRIQRYRLGICPTGADNTISLYLSLANIDAPTANPYRCYLVAVIRVKISSPPCLPALPWPATHCAGSPPSCPLCSWVDRDPHRSRIGPHGSHDPRNVQNPFGGRFVVRNPRALMFEGLHMPQMRSQQERRFKGQARSLWTGNMGGLKTADDKPHGFSARF
jgi:hypothetical protein